MNNKGFRDTKERQKKMAEHKKRLKADLKITKKEKCMIEQKQELSSGYIANPSSLLVKAEGALTAASELINRSYLANLQHYPVLTPEDGDQLHIADITLFKLERLITENRQSILESAAAAYSALGAAGYTVFFLLDSDGSSTQFYMGTRCASKKMKGNAAGDLLSKSIKGHFPGSQLSKVKSGDEVLQKLNFIGMSEKFENLAVTAVTGIPALNTEEREHFTQGLERFLDAAEGEVYRALILAEPIATNQLNIVRAGFEATATQLSPLQKQQVSYGVNESESIALSLAESLSTSLSETMGLTETKGTNSSRSISEGTSESTTKDPSMLIGVTGSALAIGGAALLASNPLGWMAAGMIAGAGASVAKGISSAAIGSKTSGSSTNVTDTNGTSESTSRNSGTTETTGNTNSRTDTSTTSVGSNRQITVDTINKPVEQLLTRIDHHLERLDEACAYGGWQTAAYFVGKDTTTAEALGSMFLGLMRGQSSGAEDFSLTTWNKGSQSRRTEVVSWLSNLTHPRFKPDFTQHLAVDYVTPASLLSGRELAIQLSLPRRSSAAVMVLDAVAFGRSITHFDVQAKADQIRIGAISNFGVISNNQTVDLNVNSFTSHVFITGSTGTGKSNAIYVMLDKLYAEKKIPFLIIEPAKGEYKQVFGGRNDVHVFGTNSKLTPLLKINPFSFPDGIHVMEHIDRLVEILNAVWPMYAAMPAILKEAIELCYVRMGWDLLNSENQHPSKIFPDFVDLLAVLPEIINQSDYSQEMKGNYIGALVTRVKSLTNGYFGAMFQKDELPSSVLFDKPCIVDLSRVGSSETKALFMGVLFLKLQEYRMSEAQGTNSGLKHITVLEEAHNLLRRTSGAQGQDSANLQGQSVEMIANAIAEMRTYGEGFIIADQAPGLLDPSAIRNTNTKIILRLPDFEDRNLVGKSAHLNDDQIEELARLKTGCAAIYQNNWLEPVLCQFDNFDSSKITPFSYVVSNTPLVNARTLSFTAHIKELIEISAQNEGENFNNPTLLQANNYYPNPPAITNRVDLQRYVKHLFNLNALLDRIPKVDNLDEWVETLSFELGTTLNKQAINADEQIELLNLVLGAIALDAPNNKEAFAHKILEMKSSQHGGLL